VKSRWNWWSDATLLFAIDITFMKENTIVLLTSFCKPKNIKITKHFPIHFYARYVGREKQWRYYDLRMYMCTRYTWKLHYAIQKTTANGVNKKNGLNFACLHEVDSLYFLSLNGRRSWLQSLKNLFQFFLSVFLLKGIYDHFA